MVSIYEPLCLGLFTNILDMWHSLDKVDYKLVTILSFRAQMPVCFNIQSADHAMVLQWGEVRMHFVSHNPKLHRSQRY